MKCSLDVGCEESGKCYAECCGKPEHCGMENNDMKYLHENDTKIAMIAWIILICGVIASLVYLVGCSYVRYDGRADGSTSFISIRLATDSDVKNAEFVTEKDKRSGKINDYNSNQTKGAEAISAGAVKGLVKGIIP